MERKRVRFHATEEVLGTLWTGRLQAGMANLWNGHQMMAMTLEDYFSPCPLPWEGLSPVGPFLVEVHRTVHHVPTSALKVHHDGRILGYSADTAFDPGLVEWLSEADFIIHETNRGPAHTPLEALAGLPEALRERMGLVHYPDDLDPASSPIRLLREGEVAQV